jgi:hypothetical protein
MVVFRPRERFGFSSAVTGLNGLFVWFAIPEMTDRTLEDMNELFNPPWYKIGRYGNREISAEEMQARETRAETRTNERFDIGGILIGLPAVFSE